IGYTGSKGYTGSASTVIGYTGSTGAIGYTGSKGYTGSQGIQGYTGSNATSHDYGLITGIVDNNYDYGSLT
ncbi:MAG: collagen-like protein, partial [Candidatus ainarchaeum sp.]|nr:collagen-like protein [Candidatus ainarchaeum sp.]